jgi:hypothetical protein
MDSATSPHDALSAEVHHCSQKIAAALALAMELYFFYLAGFGIEKRRLRLVYVLWNTEECA